MRHRYARWASAIAVVAIAAMLGCGSSDDDSGAGSTATGTGGASPRRHGRNGQLRKRRHDAVRTGTAGMHAGMRRFDDAAERRDQSGTGGQMMMGTGGAMSGTGGSSSDAV